MQGPNFAWHIDQYDKLSTFGFYIHGCIDGYNIIALLSIIPIIMHVLNSAILGRFYG